MQFYASSFDKTLLIFIQFKCRPPPKPFWPYPNKRSPLLHASVSFLLSLVLGWPKSPFGFFCKIKDTFFIFINNFTDLDILGMLATSCYWLLVGGGQGAAKYLPMHKTAPQQMSVVPKAWQTTFDTCNRSVREPSYTAQILLFSFTCFFT